MATMSTVAKLVIQKVSEATDQWNSRPGNPRMGIKAYTGVSDGLMPEIRRLSNVVTPNPNGGGWVTVPFEDAVRQNMFSPDDLEEIEGGICFFTLISAVTPRAKVKEALEMIAPFWGAQLESSNVTEYAASLTTSTPGSDSQSARPVSSVPT
jgi:hypothetical protein